MGAASILTFNKNVFGADYGYQLQLARRLSAYMSSRALATNTTSSCNWPHVVPFLN